METKNLIKKYKNIFMFLKRNKNFEKLENEFKVLCLDYEKIESLSKYYINDNGFIITFGKVKCLENKTTIYLTISKNYITVYDEEFLFKNKKNK